MESVATTQVKSVAGTIAVATRPVNPTDGVDITTFQSAGICPTKILAAIVGDGSGNTLAAPTGGTTGPELWGYRADRTGTLRWWLIGYLNSKATLTVAGAAGGGYCEAVQILPGLFSRLAIAGTVSAGAIGYYFESLEYTAH